MSANAITTALRRVSLKIPRKVLQIAFIEPDPRLAKLTSLDDSIMQKVLLSRVLPDINLVGGIEARIPIDKCDVTMLDYNTYTVHVPKSVTNNKSIVSVLSLIANNIYPRDATMNGSVVNFGVMNMSPIISNGMKLMNTVSDEYVAQTAKLELISENLVYIQEPSIVLVTGIMKVKLTNSPNLENINPRNYIAFSELVVLAVKSYIYNTLVVELDRGYIMGGQELSVIKDIVDSYADAETMYEEFLETKWSKIAILNDTFALHGIIKSMVPTTA